MYNHCCPVKFHQSESWWSFPINLNVFGAWNYSAPGGHGTVTGPTIIGFITGAWGRYNHEFRIK